MARPPLFIFFPWALLQRLFLHQHRAGVAGWLWTKPQAKKLIAHHSFLSHDPPPPIKSSKRLYHDHPEAYSYHDHTGPRNGRSRKGGCNGRSKRQNEPTPLRVFSAYAECAKRTAPPRSQLPPIGFCIDILIGSKFIGSALPSIGFNIEPLIGPK
jgi:hypothetical protein